MKIDCMDNIILDLPYKKASRKNSFVTIEQIYLEHYNFINKISRVLFESKYGEKSKEIARQILDFLVDWEYVTWKQFDMIMNIFPQKKIKQIIPDIGCCDDGYVTMKRNDGTTYSALPIFENESKHFNITNPF